MAKRKSITSLVNRVFHSRKIIVVSDHSIDYYPVSRSLQSVMFLSVLGFVTWASYSTGSFMAAQSQILEKDRAIEKVNLENRKINNEYSLLKQDLFRMKDKEGELSEYAQFVINQYSGNNKLTSLSDFTKKMDESNHAMMFERISFLESRIEDLKSQNADFVDTIRQITAGKISELEKVISLTGLNQRTLKTRYLAGLSKEENEMAQVEDGPQGGPYIPYSGSELMDESKKSAVKDVENLMQLYAIMELLPLDKPMQSNKVSSNFGRRIDPFTHRLAQHLGMDFSGPAGAKAYATSDGEVTFQGRRGAYGNMVEIDHGLGIATRYGHLSRILVKEGQRVKKGQAIGVQGSTGRSTGNHLHYEVRFNGRALNPVNFLKAGQYVSKKQ